MTEKEKAEFIHSILTADSLQIPASLADKMAECQKWMGSWPNENVSIRKV